MPENKKITDIHIKPGPKKIAESTGEQDKRQRDNKNTPSLKPHKHIKGK